MPNITVDDIQLHYEVYGRGTPLVLLMGMAAAGDLWGPDFIDALAARFRVIAPDNRGTGSTRRGTEPYTFARLAKDVAGLLDQEGILAAHIFGVSMGGMIAQQLAIDYPARLRGLVLGCTSAGGPDAAPPRRSIVEDIQRHGLAGVASALVTPEFVNKRTGLLTKLAVRAMARPTPPAILREQLAAIMGFNVAARLSEIVTPTLVLTGDRDRLIAPENAKLLARGIRGAKGAIVKDTAHCFFWEAPQRVAAVVSEFLTPLSPGLPVRVA